MTRAEVSHSFTWDLASGVVIDVDASGYYDSTDESVWPVTLAFATPYLPETQGAPMLRALLAEYPQIEEHARIMLAEVGRAQSKEAV
jgi:hypothetical protein